MAGPTLPVLIDPVSTVRRKRARPLLPLGVVFVLAGVVLMGVCAVFDESRQEDNPYGGAALAVGVTPPFPEEGATAVRIRRVPPEQFPSLLAYIEDHIPRDYLGSTWEEDRESIAEWERRTEYVVLAAITDAPHYADLLVAGRLPEPGKPEVLAGPLVRLDQFRLGGETFTVTGRIAPRVPAFMDAYLLPAHPRWAALFSAENGGEPGWFTRDASAWLEQARESAEEANSTALAAEAEPPLDRGNSAALRAMGDGLEAGFAMTDRGLVILGIVALGLVALGATFFFTGVAHAMHGLGGPWPLGGLMMPLLESIVRRPVLWWGLHLGNYAVMLGLMGVATAHPRLVANLSDWMAMVFSEGELSYVGAAYASKSIVSAAGATFMHNFFTATIKITVLPSLVFLGWGILKTAGSLALVGFIMAPLWVGTLTGYTYHSITMGIEIEAYIVVTFVTTVYALRLMRGVFQERFGANFVTGLRVIAGGVVAGAVLLFIAAFYEAATLILFRM